MLYFGAVRDLVGVSTETIDAPSSVAERAVLLEARHPVLAGRLNQVRFVVNEEFVDRSHRLREETSSR